MALDQYMAMMMAGQVPEEELPGLARAMQNRASTGARMAVSSIPEGAKQGALMQKEAQDNAQFIGEQRDRALANTLKALSRGSKGGGTGSDAFNKITSKERADMLRHSKLVKQEIGNIETWQPDFQYPLLGGAERWLGTLGIGPAGEAAEKRQTWYRQYADWENYVRKELFGSALTGYELKAWNRATVNPSMQPSLVEAHFQVRNMVLQKRTAEEAMLRMNMGWPEDTLRVAFEGVLPEEAWADLKGFAKAREKEYTEWFKAQGDNAAGELTTEELMEIAR